MQITIFPAMRKTLSILAVLLGLYLCVAIGVWCIVPRKIADVEQRLSGVRIAIARLEQDQIMLSERVKAATDATIGRGQSKVEEVAALLKDPDINHLALVYIGSDWAIQRSGFLGTVSHMRELLDRQDSDRKVFVSRTDKKIKDLESRWRTMNRNLQLTRPESLGFAAMMREIHEIERQLDNYRYSNALSAEVRKDSEDRKFAVARATMEANIFKIASDYQEQTVGVLNRIMAEKLYELRLEANKPDHLRRILSPFNIWPLNKIVKLPLPDEDEKQL